MSVTAAVIIAPALKWFAGAGLGYLSGLSAEWMKARQDARDKAHELALLEIQLRFADKRATVAMAEIEAAGPAGVAADLEATQMAYEGPKPTGMKKIDFLNGILRPWAGAAAISAFCWFSFVFLVALAKVMIWDGTVTFEAGMIAFEGSVIADCIVAVWGFTFGSRNFRASRSS